MQSPHVHLETNSTYLPEVWTWFVIGVVVICLRWGVRIRTVGFRGFEGDDYISLIFLGLWTLNAAIVQITYYTGGAIDITPDQVSLLSDSDVSILEYGTKMEFISWYSYPGVIWTLKFKVLFFYRRLKSTMWWNDKTIVALFWATFISWAILVLSISVTCRPFSANWQIRPLPGSESTFRAQNFWILVFLNVLTDFAILSVPLPILWHLRASRLRKMGISLLLTSGVFMIGTAIVRAVATIVAKPSVININRWGFRETGVGMLAVNAPILVPFFTRAFWRKGAYRPYLRPDPGLYVAIQRPRQRNEPGVFDVPITLSSITTLEAIQMDYPGRFLDLDEEAGVASPLHGRKDWVELEQFEAQIDPKNSAEFGLTLDNGEDVSWNGLKPLWELGEGHNAMTE
ncbi:hypothetical protein B0J14DRAFT_368253 [Halenospora varia]|nr:hypothetical protein B0J14DRAFT_368253 [Halenospora varia]